MPWIQLTLTATPDLADPIEQLLLTCGAVAVTLLDGADEPVFEPQQGTTPLWRQTRMTGLFDAQMDKHQLLCQLQQVWQQVRPEEPLPQHDLVILEDKDWERAWMDCFEPTAFGERLWICPSCKSVPDPQAVNLMLDPGLAFGTGRHPTTALCLEWLASHPLDGSQVIDYGCGSGVLAIAALLLGSASAVAVDHDTQALLAAHDNAMRNNISLDRLIFCLPQQLPQQRAHIILANILAGPLIKLATTLADHTTAGGYLVLSGILYDQVDAVINAYQPWFDEFDVIQRAEWVRIEARKI